VLPKHFDKKGSKTVPSDLQKTVFAMFSMFTRTTVGTLTTATVALLLLFYF
jgi:hypothetical protein